MNSSSAGEHGRSLVIVRRFRAVRRPARELGSVELVTDRLWSLGATAVEQRDDELRAGFPTNELAVAAADAVRATFGSLDVSVRSVDDDSWADRWRVSAAPVVRVGERVVVRPSWARAAGDGAAVASVSVVDDDGWLAVVARR